MKDEILSKTRLPSNLRKTTCEYMYSVMYGKPMNIYSTPMVLIIQHWYDTWNFPQSYLLAATSVMQCTGWVA